MISINQSNSPAAPAPNQSASAAPEPNPVSTPDFPGPVGSEQLALISNLRQLWLQLAIWSRSLIVSTAAGLGDIQMITDRLTYLPDALSRLMGQYFEPQEADHIRELLEEHISTMAALFAAETAKNDQTVNQETVNLYDNAVRIADYLVSINAYWNREQWIALLDDYIQMLLVDLVARMGGDFTKEIDVFDDLQTQAIKIADYMSSGMMSKFRP